MRSKLGSHVRHNAVGYIALFFALTGVAYAAGPLKAGDPAGGDLAGTYPNPDVVSSIARDSEIFPTVLGNDGSGSTLDADKLDGLDSTAFLRSGSLIGAGAFMGRIDDVPDVTEPDEFGLVQHFYNPDGASEGAGSPTTDFTEVGFLSPNATIVARDLAVATSVAPGVGEAREFHLRVPGAGAITCSTGAASSGCSNGSDTLTISPQSLVFFQVTDICSGSARIVCPPSTDVVFGWRATTP